MLKGPGHLRCSIVISAPVFLLLLLITLSSFGGTRSSLVDNVDTLEKYPALADPCILEYKGKYYLYGTSDKASEGFKVYVSNDLINWSGAVGAKGGFALHKDDVWGDRSFWAPQVFRYNSKFYMAYAANESIAMIVRWAHLNKQSGSQLLLQLNRSILLYLSMMMVRNTSIMFVLPMVGTEFSLPN